MKKKMSDDFSSAGFELYQKAQQSYLSFKDLLLERLCDRHKDLGRNHDLTEFVFKIKDIPRKTADGGFGIDAAGGDALNYRLLKFENEDHFISVDLSKGEFRLTQLGIDYCKES